MDNVVDAVCIDQGRTKALAPVKERHPAMAGALIVIKLLSTGLHLGVSQSVVVYASKNRRSCSSSNPVCYALFRGGLGSPTAFIWKW